MWTHTPTETVSNFSPTSLSKSHRSILKARRILTSTAALKRRLVQDEGENIPPLTFSSYNTQAKDYPFLFSTLPPRGVKLTLTAEYHRYEKIKPDTKPTLFWTLQVFLFFLFRERKKTGILWIFQHLISVGDVDGAAQHDSFCELHFLSKRHKQIWLIHSKGQPQPKQRKTTTKKKGGLQSASWSSHPST